MISGWFKRITFMFDYICVWFIENQTPRSLWQEMEPRQWCECWEELLLQMRLRSLAHSDLLFLTGGLWPRGQGPLVENMVYIGLIQAQLKRVYIFLSLGGMFCKCQSGQGEWLLLKSVWILIFLLVLSISKMGVLKSPTLTVILPIPHCGFSQILLMYFKAMLLVHQHLRLWCPLDGLLILMKLFSLSLVTFFVLKSTWLILLQPLQFSFD